MSSLIRCGLEAAGFADTFCSAVLMLFSKVDSAIDCLVHLCAQLLYHICDFLSQLLHVTIVAAATISVHSSAAGAAAAAADIRRLSSVSTRVSVHGSPIKNTDNDTGTLIKDGSNMCWTSAGVSDGVMTPRKSVGNLDGCRALLAQRSLMMHCERTVYRDLCKVTN